MGGFFGLCFIVIAAHNFTFQENTMRSFQRLGAAFVLACALTLPALAGEMDTGMGRTSPPPPPPATSSAATQGGMHTGPGAVETAGDSLTEAVLSLLAGVLALF